jgi:hypothetical protein
LIRFPTRTAPRRNRRFEADALIDHPTRGRERFRNQNFGQLGIGPVTRHPAQIGPERIARICFDTLDEAPQFARLRNQLQNFLGVIEGDPQQAATVMRVAAAHFLGRLLQHQHALCTGVARRDARRERRVTSANYNYVVIRHCSRAVPILTPTT